MSAGTEGMSADESGGGTIAELGEGAILAEIFSHLPPPHPDVLVGPGDDTALLRVAGATLATTDTMVRGRDWIEEWSSPFDIGAKIAVQNLADLAAMGGVGSGLLVTLVAPGSLPLSWVREMTRGLAEVAKEHDVAIIGGDLSSSMGEVMVSVTALGSVPGPGPVLRSGAQRGDVIATSERLGRSAAGLHILQKSQQEQWPSPEVADAAAELVGFHCQPQPDLSQGPIAASSGAHALIDVSDGLDRDLGRIMEASVTRAELHTAALEEFVAALEPVVGAEDAWTCVLTGGEEHSLLGCFAPTDVPPGWTVIGDVREAAGEAVWLDGEPLTAGGWDHFSRR